MTRRRRAPPFSLFAFQDIITATTGIFVLIAIILALALVNSVPKRSRDSSSDDNLEALREKLVSLTKRQRQLQTEFAAELRLTKSLAAATPERVKNEIDGLSQDIEALRHQEGQLEEALQRVKKEVEAAKARNSESAKKLAQLTLELKAVEAELAAISKRLIFKAAPSRKKAWLVQLARDRIELASAASPNDTRVFRSADRFYDAADSLSPSRDYFVIVIRPSAVDAYTDVFSNLHLRGFEIGEDAIAEDDSYLGMAD